MGALSGTEGSLLDSLCLCPSLVFAVLSQASLPAAQRSLDSKWGNLGCFQANDGLNNFRRYPFHLGRDLGGTTATMNIYEGAEEALPCVGEKGSLKAAPQ